MNDKTKGTIFRLYGIASPILGIIILGIPMYYNMKNLLFIRIIQGLAVIVFISGVVLLFKGRKLLQKI